MFTIPFWVAFGCALLASLGVSFYYGRHAIHPRLRPHFGQVVILFLLLALASFALALVIGQMVGKPLPGSPPGPQTPAGEAAPAPAPPAATP